jgi:hypothetical protein
LVYLVLSVGSLHAQWWQLVQALSAVISCLHVTSVEVRMEVDPVRQGCPLVALLCVN